MPLLCDVTFTPGSPGNLYGGSGGLSLAANTSVTIGPFYVGVAGQSGLPGTTATGSAIGARVEVVNSAGSSVTAGSSVSVAIYSTSDGSTYDTIPFDWIYFAIATVASSAASESFDLVPGQYQLVLTNTDTMYPTTVQATLGTYN